jgi:hypothetical protein
MALEQGMFLTGPRLYTSSSPLILLISRLLALGFRVASKYLRFGAFSFTSMAPAIGFSILLQGHLSMDFLVLL